MEKTNPLPCPVCTVVANYANPIHTDALGGPAAGDVAVCYNCGAVLNFEQTPAGELYLAVAPFEQLKDLRAQDAPLYAATVYLSTKWRQQYEKKN